MILADKIIQLRKKNGWSQEELAEKLGVSRQAVSKWEGAQATPDLGRLLAMSQLFGVTTDYLLKDDMEQEEAAPEEGGQPLRRVALAEADAFLSWRDKASLLIACGVLLCMVGVAIMLALMAAGDYASVGISPELGGSLGVGILLVCTAAAVGVFIYCGHKNSPYEFLDKEDFDTEYGVEGMARKKRQAQQKSHLICLCVGIALCVVSPIPLIMGALLYDFSQALMLCPTVLLAGVGTALCIVAGVRRAAVDKLLKQGDYSLEAKRISRAMGPVSAVYWLLATAIFLAWSFLGNAWDVSWMLWPIAGVLYAALRALCSLLMQKKDA